MITRRINQFGTTVGRLAHHGRRIGWILLAFCLLLAAGASHACESSKTGVPCNKNATGDPINAMTGNNFQREVDLPALPGVLGLEIVRYYNSELSQPGSTPGILGRGWKLSYEAELMLSGRSLQIREADGTLRDFTCDAIDTTRCESDDHTQGTVEILSRSIRENTTYRWLQNDGKKLLFNHRGNLVQIEAPTGEIVSLQYDARQMLMQVSDPQGRTLRLHHLDQQAVVANPNRFRGVHWIDSPVGRFHYTYGSALPKGATLDASATWANLVKVEYPSTDVGGNVNTTNATNKKISSSGDSNSTSSSVGRLYQYEDALRPAFLTGISIAGRGSDSKLVTQRYASFSYNVDGKAVFANHADNTDKVTLDYRTGGQTTVTNSRGQTTVYRYTILAGQYRLLELRGAGCSLCAEPNVRYGYDKLGREIEVTKLSAQGMPLHAIKTERDYLGRPLKISRIDYRDGIPTAPQLQARYEYGSGTVALPTLIARPSVIPGKEHQIRTNYNQFGQPIRVAETGFSPALDNGQINLTAATATTRVITYHYQSINGRSLLVQIDGPLKNGGGTSAADNDITRFIWDKYGSMVEQIIYPTQRIARFSYQKDAINPTVRLIKSTGIDGVVTELDYDPRGAITQMRRGGAVTRYQHDQLGRTTEVIQPNGEHLQFGFDGGNQVTTIFDQQNNRIQLARNTEGALIEARLLDPNGKLAQAPRRFVDESAPTQSASSTATGANATMGSTRSATSANTEPSRDAVLAGVKQLIATTQNNDDTNVARPNLSAAPYLALQAFIEAAQIDGSGSDTSEANTAVHRATDTAGAITTYITDDFGNLLQVQSPTTGTTSYRYDLAGHLLGRRHANGSHADYQRDAAGRVIAMQAVDARNHIDESARIDWGRADKPVRITYLAGEEHFAYDDAARLIEHTQSVDGQLFKLTYRYDATGQLLAKTLPDGQTLNYRYRSPQHPRAGLLESVWLQRFNSDTANQLSGDILARPVVQGMNNVADRYQQRSFSFGNGLSNTISLDMQGRITSAGNVAVGQTQLRYDGIQNGESAIDTAASSAAAIESEFEVAEKLPRIM